MYDYRRESKKLILHLKVFVTKEYFFLKVSVIMHSITKLKVYEQLPAILHSLIKLKVYETNKEVNQLTEVTRIPLVPLMFLGNI